jgi:hypothetical protein
VQFLNLRRYESGNGLKVGQNLCGGGGDLFIISKQFDWLLGLVYIADRFPFKTQREIVTTM